MVARTSAPDANGCCLWEGSIMNTGYGCMWDGRKTDTTHRLSYELHVGPIPPGMWVLHKCDVRACINPDHLFVGTPTDNIRDCVAKGRHRCAALVGEEAGPSKLKEWEVVAILRDRRSNDEVAAHYGVSRQNIRRIRMGETWKHIPRT